MSESPNGKAAKTRKTRQQTAEGVIRLVRGYGRRIAREGDADDMESLRKLEDAVTEALATAVAGLSERGFSWADIGRGYGIRRTSAFDRWGKPGNNCVQDGAVPAGE